MDSSNPRAFALALVLTLVLVAGCAHAGAAARPASPAAPAAAGAGGTLDPSEEITPAELASIPEPVPLPSPAPPRRTGGAEATDSALASEEPQKAPPEGSEPRSAASGDSGGGAPAIAAPAGDWAWRVQVLATTDRALADRVAREAVDRLGTTSRIDLESGLYKVRLGSFPSEADAQILKQRAVEMGYPGAFRIKIRVRATDE
jgi:hypothetical protein